MILERHREAVRSIDLATASRALEMLDAASAIPLGEIWTLDAALDAAGRGQDDLVLCLLRMDTESALTYVERVMGKPVTRCPPQVALCRPPPPPVARPRAGDDRRVVSLRSVNFLRVMSQIVRPGSRALARTGKTRVALDTPMYDRLGMVRVGLSVTQLLARGVTRRDLRIAERRGWLTLEERPT